MAHSPRFLALIEDARSRVPEVTPEESLRLMRENPGAALIDVREESEYAAAHVKGAEHLGKGVIERDIENAHPNLDQPLYLYCGGGFRSLLAGDNLKKMGYRNVFSVSGGYRSYVQMGVEMEK